MKNVEIGSLLGYDSFSVWQIECEPEYLMGDFENNPDIDENPPIPLRDALEKMKPFLMAYENIQSHEEWEVSFSVTSCFRFFVPANVFSTC